MSATRCALWLLGAVLCVGCGTPPAAPTASTRSVDAAAPIADAGPADAEVPAPAPVPAPGLDTSLVVNMIGDREEELLVDGTSNVDVPMAADGCVRVVFSAGAPVDVSLGARSVTSRTSGVLAEKGAVCERAGHALRLSFVGHANVRYQVFRTRP